MQGWEHDGVFRKSGGKRNNDNPTVTGRGVDEPTTKRGMRSFLGAVSFYRRYMQLLAKDTAVLSLSTSKTAPFKVPWMEEMEKAFHHICKSVYNECIIIIPLPEDTMSIVTDTSGSGIGEVLQVTRGSEWKAAAFYSGQTRGPEHRYSATELEALALVETVRHFGYYLYGKVFTAYTDHKPLCMCRALQWCYSAKDNTELK